MKKPDQQKIKKQLSSCLTEKFNGFTIIRSEYEKKLDQTSNRLTLSINRQKTLWSNHFVILVQILH